ncbi:MAG TPA: MBL fold metallo-hydrolase [Phycisphaerales bacterium]|nr:MBL fold metallo-hydrolase [Phycisphaerales bacterium]
MPDNPTPPRYTFTLLRAGTFKLDGGSMFGLIPRAVWSRHVPTDDKGRITVAHNCLLLQREGEAPPGPPRRLLIEGGTGDKLDPKMQEVFDLEQNPPGHPNAGTPRTPRTILDALAEKNVPPESIDAIICSHLHFDHAGALTRLPRPGEKPTWLVPPNDMGGDGGGGSAQTGGNVLSFPNATIHTQHREWHDAINNRSVMTKTYYRDHLAPIADRLRPTDSPRPFPTGYTPDREELPRTTIEQRESDPFAPSPSHLKSEISNLRSGISVFLTPGHTWGQQAIKFTDPRNRTIVFTPDVMPTIAHLGAAYNLAYDVEPYTSTITRHWFLAEAAARDWVLHLDHEPGHPLVRVRRNTKGWFDLIPEPL